MCYVAKIPATYFCSQKIDKYVTYLSIFCEQKYIAGILQPKYFAFGPWEFVIPTPTLFGK